jgi:lipopolysaccharide transport system ATP-binding protein
MNGTILGMKRKEIDKKLDEIIEFSGVEKFMDTPVKRYSSGMKVRLAFAVAAHLEPEILIIDEVLAVGDSEFQKKCLGKMGDISQQGRTILFVSHNLTAVKSLCSKAILLRGGKMAFSGDVESVIHNYLDQEFNNVSNRVWEPENAPGNEHVKLLKASLQPITQNGSDVITIATPLKVAFEFEMLEDGYNVHLSLLLYKSDGDVVFNTYSSATKAEKRRYQSECIIPGNLLNDGSYYFEICIVKNNSILLYKFTEVLVFDALDLERGENSAFGKIVGVVRPQLEWRFPL